MNPYKSQSIQFVIALETRGIDHREIQSWVSAVLNKTHQPDIWMNEVLMACSRSTNELITALNAIPLTGPDDEAWERYLRKPITNI